MEIEEKKEKTIKIIKNILCATFVPLIILGCYIGVNFKPDKEFVKYSHETPENTYVAVDIVAIQACVESYDVVLENEGTEIVKGDQVSVTEYECVFVSDDGYTGIITIDEVIYNGEQMKPIIAAMSDVTLSPEPVRFYGNTTTEISSKMEEWLAEGGFDPDIMAPVRIKGSIMPEKEVSKVGTAIIFVGIFAGLAGFVLALMVNLKQGKRERQA
ncbi:MAG: hypothetical protein Q4G23_00770 [Clostridia bacterium]|nr:hypothetical protein [Clostridia bacterium]